VNIDGEAGDRPAHPPSARNSLQSSVSNPQWSGAEHTITPLGKNMNKSELIDKVAAVAELNKASATRAVEAVLDSVAQALKGGDQVTLSGFGTFSVTSRAARTGRNPRTGESISIPASKNPKFKAGKGLKDTVN
jgi:DNA-binding protein HU-beta